MNYKHKNRTLWLATILHCFTHLYMVALIPLYVLIKNDFKLSSIGQVTLLVTLQMMGYFLPGIYIGKLADKFSRTTLLSIGLFINSAAFILLGLSPSYGLAICSVILAGFGGSFYHPAAISLISKLYPNSTGAALGICGIGSGVGFFIGPLYSGWRAATAGNWRMPMIELGIAGLIMCIVFVLLAEKDKPQANLNVKTLNPPIQIFNSYKIWIMFIVACILFSLRDFTSGGMTSLTSLYLQNAHSWSSKQTGIALSMISLASAISSPLFGYLSDKNRYSWTVMVLIIASILIFIFPYLRASNYILVLVIYGFFFMASFALIEAALMQSFDDSIRGRIYGVFLTICCFIGNMAHWVVGKWVETLGNSATSPIAYQRFYLILSVFVLISLLGLPLLESIRRRRLSETESFELTINEKSLSN
ncbi:MAG TPA: MFS transporter [Verrucomicrobiota bacterium]|nr:MFS transporter [Verrucomicrobiota bacterium]